jgi:hypothetical protein
MQPQQTSSNFSPSADIQNLINAIFEQIDQKKSIREMDVKREMRALALSSEHIKEQDLDELKNSLEKVDDIISTIRHNAEPSRDPNKLILANIALAFMYGKKSHIIERIRELQSSEAIKDIADQAKKEPESTILEKIEDLVQSQFELSREVKEAREESSVYTERAKVIKEERD